MLAGCIHHACCAGNPVGRWWKHHARPVTGALFGMAGRKLWELSNWWQDGKVHSDLRVLLGVLNV